MMKKVRLFAAIAAILSMVSCQKEDAVKGMNDNDIIFTASIASNGTKTSVAAESGKVSWCDDDEISVTDASNTTVIYSVSAINDGRATFTKKEGESGTLGEGPYTAVYGSAPASEQTYSATAPELPMTAVSNSNSLEFSVTCGLLEIVLEKSGVSIKSISVSDGTNTYTLTCPEAVDITSEAKFFMALPAGEYKTLSFTKADGSVCTKEKADASVSVSANHIKPVSFSLTFPIDGALPGSFTMDSEGTQLHFAKGNLYYNNGTLKLEDNQYGTYPTSSGNMSTSHLCHFHFSSSISDAINFNGGGSIDPVIFTNDLNDETKPNSKITINGQTGKWRVPTRAEWLYLIDTRTVNGGKGKGYSFENCCTGVTIEGKTYKGLFIFPDGFTKQSSWKTDFTTWAQIDEAGVVFLPAAGYGSSGEASYIGTEGKYWSSTRDTNDKKSAFDLSFDSKGFTAPSGMIYGAYYCTIRLVSAAE